MVSLIFYMFVILNYLYKTYLVYLKIIQFIKKCINGACVASLCVLLTNTFDLTDLLKNKSKCKAKFMWISLIVTITTINLQKSTLAFPTHFDRTGYPMCHDISFTWGQSSLVVPCPVITAEHFVMNRMWVPIQRVTKEFKLL